jgi:Mitochondrial carrier protein
MVMSDHAQKEADGIHHQQQHQQRTSNGTPNDTATAPTSPSTSNSLLIHRRTSQIHQSQHQNIQEHGLPSSSPRLPVAASIFQPPEVLVTKTDRQQLPVLPPGKRSTTRPADISRRSTILQEEGPIAEPTHSTSFICGLLAGIAQAGVFNPYDRALYLSVRDNRKFLHPINWYNPYTGFVQSISGRAIQGGLYFPLEHYFLHTLNDRYSNTSKSKDGDPRLNFLAGTAAGAVNAVLLNPISAVKYKTWGREVNNGIFHEVIGMIRKSGFSIRPFYNGVIPTVMRDVVFGGTYTWLRLQIKIWFSLSNQQQWMGNFVAAGLATILSGPFNYVRTIQFATRSHEIAPSTIHILKNLMNETLSKDHETVFSRLQFLQNKLRIGWGTARVAIGMAFAHSVYNWLHDTIKNHNIFPHGIT